jgi:hypothetical protein
MSPATFAKLKAEKGAALAGWIYWHVAAKNKFAHRGKKK